MGICLVRPTVELAGEPGCRHRSVHHISRGRLRGDDRDWAEHKTDIGKLILTACFVCDLGTVGALGVLFANYNVLLVLFVVATVIVLVFFTRALNSVVRMFGHAVSEPEVKFVFLMLFLLGGLAAAAKSEAVLPAYLLAWWRLASSMRTRA